MAMVPYRRRGEGGMARFRDEMTDLFSRFFEGFEWPLAQAGWAPALDIAEREDSIVVKAELPGMKAEDIDISVQDNNLVISGDKKEEREEKGEGYYHVERRYGTFHRNIPLPASVDANKIQAKHRDGVLTITLPKTEAAKPKKVKVVAE